MSAVESINTKTGVVVLKATDVEAIPESEAGQPNGIATLNGSGTLPEAQLPSSVVSSSTVNHGEVEGEQTPNLAEGRVHTYVAKGSFVLEKPTNWPAGTTYVSIEVMQDSTGGHKITAPGLTWIGGPGPTFSEAPNAVNVIQLVSFNGGTNWFGETGPEGAKGETGPEGAGSMDSYLALARPIWLIDSILPFEEATNATALKAYFNRIVIPKTGVLHDVAVPNGGTVNGNHNVALFDTGQAVAGKYTKLWESSSVAAAGEKKWQVVGSPGVAVTKGDQLLLAIMNSGTTHKWGVSKASISGAIAELPENFIPTTGGAKPKVLAQHLFTELKYATITEAQLEPGGQAIPTIARVE